MEAHRATRVGAMRPTHASRGTPSPLYRMYVLLQRWKHVAIGELLLLQVLSSAPPPPPPSGSLLSELLVYVRLRRGALERLRSVRRWQLMYVSQLDLFAVSWLPQTKTQVECLVNAHVSWIEWRVLQRLAARAQIEAEAAVVALRLRGGLAAWREACELLAYRPMSVASRCFAAWRGLVAKRAALEHRGAWLRRSALLSQPLWRWHAHAHAHAALHAALAPAILGILSYRMARGWRTWVAAAAAAGRARGWARLLTNPTARAWLHALSTWRAHAAALSATRAAVRRVLAHWMRRKASQAWAAWVSWRVAAVVARERGSIAARRMLYASSVRVLLRWRAATAARSLPLMALTRWCRGAEARALNTLRASGVARAACRRALHRTLNHRLAAATRTWRGAAAAAAAQRERAYAAVTRWWQGSLSAALNSWTARAAAAARARQLLARACLVWAGSLQLRVLRAWRGVLDEVDASAADAGRIDAARVGTRGALRHWAREVREQRLMAAALRRLANTALTAALFRLRAVAAAAAARRLALRRWRAAAVVHALRTWRDTTALASRAGKALRSVARLLVHRDVARGWRSWIALTAAHQRLHVVVWRVLQHQSVLALNTWRHVAAERAATRLLLRKVIAAWASALLRAIVRGWAEAAQAEAAARHRAIAFTADARASARAWRTWAAAATARVRALRLVRGCLAKLVRGATQRAFNSLAAAAAPCACGRAALRVWCTHLLGRAFRTWWGALEARGAVRALLGRALGLWRGESAVRAWAAWRARTATAVAIEETLARVLAHWRGGSLLRALNSWRAAADAAHKAWVAALAHRLHPARRSLRALRHAVTRERQMAHAVAHWWGGSAACAFRTWRSRAAVAMAQRERAYAAVARWWHVLRTAAWNSWAARAAATAHARRQLVAALRFWRGCEVQRRGPIPESLALALPCLQPDSNPHPKPAPEPHPLAPAFTWALTLALPLTLALDQKPLPLAPLTS